MALTSTMHRFAISLSDVDRSVYEALDLRVARHPSESMHYMLTRVIAYSLRYQEGIELGPGLCEADAPAVRVKDGDGNLAVWIDVGTPSADRMHRASKASGTYVVYTHHDPALLVREASRERIHRLEAIEAFRVDPRFLTQLEPLVERHTKLELTMTEGQLYARAGDKSFDTSITRIALAPDLASA